MRGRVSSHELALEAYGGVNLQRVERATNVSTCARPARARREFGEFSHVDGVAINHGFGGGSHYHGGAKALHGYGCVNVHERESPLPNRVRASWPSEGSRSVRGDPVGEGRGPRLCPPIMRGGSDCSRKGRPSANSWSASPPPGWSAAT